MSLSLTIMVEMKDFSRKWVLVKIYPFTSQFTLYGHIEYYKLLCTYLFRYIFINFQNIKFIATLKMLRETMYVTQASFAIKR